MYRRIVYVCCSTRFPSRHFTGLRIDRKALFPTATTTTARRFIYLPTFMRTAGNAHGQRVFGRDSESRPPSPYPDGRDNTHARTAPTFNFVSAAVAIETHLSKIIIIVFAIYSGGGGEGGKPLVFEV